MIVAEIASLRDAAERTSNLYVASELHLLVLVVAAFAIVFLVVAGACAVVNRLAGRRVLRPWVWGGLGAASWFVLAVAYHFVMVYRMRAGS